MQICQKVVLAADMPQNDLRRWFLLNIPSIGPQKHEENCWCFCPACRLYFVKCHQMRDESYLILYYSHPKGCTPTPPQGLHMQTPSLQGLHAHPTPEGCTCKLPRPKGCTRTLPQGCMCKHTHTPHHCTSRSESFRQQHLVTCGSV